MSDVVVYSARPERALAVALHLQSRGIACRIVQGPAIAFPWVVAGLARHQVVVADTAAGRAHELLQARRSAEAASAGRLTRSARWPLVAVAVAGVGVVACGIAFIESGSAGYSIAALGHFVVLVIAFRWLRNSSRSPTESAPS